MTDHTPTTFHYGEWTRFDPPLALAPAPTRHRRPASPKRVAILAFLIAAVVSTGAAFAVAGLSGRLGADSGIAACKILAAPTPSPSAHDDRASFERKDDQAKAYGKLRKMFADSRHEDLQRAGVQLVDVTMQIVAYPDGALALVGTFSSAYAATAGACGAHGVPLPPIGSD